MTSDLGVDGFHDGGENSTYFFKIMIGQKQWVPM